jgi:hypothetical protein
MNLQENDKGTLSFGDGSSARVYIMEIEHSRSGMFPSDYWFEYEEGETNRQIVHPDFGKSLIIKSSIVLPEELVSMIFKKDESDISESVSPDGEYESLLDNHLKQTMRPEDYNKGLHLFRQLEKLMSKEEITSQYFKS